MRAAAAWQKPSRISTIARLANTDSAALSLADHYTVAKRPDEARKLLHELTGKNSAYAAASMRLAALDAGDGHRAQAQDRFTKCFRSIRRRLEPLLSARFS
jgi:thioredoxin-like negative regulator of GroEL